MNDKQRKEIRQQFWDDDYFDGLPNKGELLKHFINEYGKAIERQQQAEIEELKKEAALQRLSDFTQEAEKTLTDEEIDKLATSKMNKKIKQLAEQAGLYAFVSDNGVDLDVEKFAELIVNECAEIAIDVSEGLTVATAIRKHFGIKS